MVGTSAILSPLILRFATAMRRSAMFRTMCTDYRPLSVERSLDKADRRIKRGAAKGI